jgi:hypothetical protein
VSIVNALRNLFLLFALGAAAFAMRSGGEASAPIAVDGRLAPWHDVRRATEGERSPSIDAVLDHWQYTDGTATGTGPPVIKHRG